MGTRVTESLSDSQVRDLGAMFEGTYWAGARTESGISEMLDRSDLVVGLEDTDSGALVAFGRVLTDFTYRAFVEDVVVADSYRGQGYGTSVVERIVDHPQLADVDSITLGCEGDLVGFYERVGFEPLDDEMHVLNLER